jgi:hypothetical protein
MVKKTCRKRLTALIRTERRNSLCECVSKAGHVFCLVSLLSYHASPVILAVLMWCLLCEAQVVGRLLTRYAMRAARFCYTSFGTSAVVLFLRAWLWLGNAGVSLLSAGYMGGRKRYAWREC